MCARLAARLLLTFYIETFPTEISVNILNLTGNHGVRIHIVVVPAKISHYLTFGYTRTYFNYSNAFTLESILKLYNGS